MTAEGADGLRARLQRIRARSAMTERHVPEDAQAPTPPSRRPPLTTCLADVEPETVRWLWPAYIPLGKLTTLDGFPGTGKSTIVLDLAARISTGRPLPDGTHSDLDGAAAVIVASAEDSASDTIAPRVLAAGGDRRRIHLLDEVPAGNSTEPWKLPRHLAHLGAEIVRLEVRLVVVDPLASFVSHDHNLLRDQAVREVLGPLKSLAEATGCAVVTVRHFTKTGGANALHRGGGAVSVIGQARAGLVVAPDPNDPGHRRYVLAGAKANLAAEASSITYEIAGHPELRCSRIVWGPPTRLRADDLLAEPVSEVERSERDQIAELLLRATERAPVLCIEARSTIRTSGFSASDKTIQRAAREAGLIARTSSTYPPQRYWARQGQALPSVDSGDDDDAASLPVPTRSTRDNADSPSDVDSPRDLSTSGNGHAPSLSEERLGDLPALA